MLQIEHLTRSVSSPIMSTCAVPDRFTNCVRLCALSARLDQPATVKVAANLIRLFSYNIKNMLQTGLIIGAWDKYGGGKIYGLPLGATILEMPFGIGGSGSTYLYGFFDLVWKEGMTKEEAEFLLLLPGMGLVAVLFVLSFHNLIVILSWGYISR